MIIVSGTVKFEPGAIKKIVPEMQKVVAATRDEEGCLYYSYSVDTIEPDIMVVLEYWKDEAALEEHFTRPHMLAWRKVFEEAGVVSRDLSVAEAGNVRKM